MQWKDGKVQCWASILDGQTRAQAAQTAALEIVVPHLALMPDAHLGKGATVGSVIPTRSALIPAAVGVDIGCGMKAVRTQFTLDDVRQRQEKYSLRELHNAIASAIPLSAGKYNETLTRSARLATTLLGDAAESHYGFDPGDYAPNWRLQLGTLGSGNHFLEVTIDERKRVWLFLHSGSRGIGNKIAQHHIKVAKERCTVKGRKLPDNNWDLAYLHEDDDSAEFRTYASELAWAQRFAHENRAEMMDRMVSCLATWMGRPVIRHEIVDCHHNYTEPEEHFGETLWVSRKGAIRARIGDRGLIPGSMGAASFVVHGLGNSDAFHSAPHGAGRIMSRSQAKRELDFPELLAQMEKRGVEWGATHGLLDEAPNAYKPIDTIMADAVDLVAVEHTFTQIVNVKGA